jgi:type I restriction-modification system DNA methylase subunit
MNTGGFAHGLKKEVKKFNGEFFRNKVALPLGREEIGELRQAAGYDWKEVDPSIFGTLLEQALDPNERKKLGAHYTPRAYVERLVIATVIEPLREDWRNVQAAAETKRAGGDVNGAAAEVQAFHDTLCKTRVLDPACGTGNFLYVSLELNEVPRRRGAGSTHRSRRSGSVAWARLAQRRSASVFRNGNQSACGGNRRTGAVDWLSAMAFPHQGRPA